MNIKILGSGCSKCKTLEKITNNALLELNINANVEKVSNMKDILSYGVLQTPCLVINEKVVLSGRVSNIKEIKEIISKYNTD